MKETANKLNTAEKISADPDFNVLTIKDVMERIGVCRCTASDIVNTRGFPKIELGGSVRIREAAFERWLRAYAGRHVITDSGRKIRIPPQNCGAAKNPAVVDKSKMLTARELMSSLHLGETTARRILELDGFPKTYSDNKVCVSLAELDKWLSRQEGKRVAIGR